MPQCINHVQSEAVAFCDICKKPICKDCIGDRDNDRTLCFKCAIQVTTKEFQKEKEDHDALREEMDKALRKKKQGAVLRRFLSIASIIFLMEISIIATNYFVVGRYIPNDQHLTNEITLRRELDDCCFRMYEVSQALQTYADQHQGRYPLNLKEINPSYLKIPPQCPKSHKLFIYKPIENGFGFILSCPEPRIYKMKKLEFSHNGGPNYERLEGK